MRARATSLGQVLEHEPGVDEIEDSFLEVVADDVVPADFETWDAERRQDPGVEVGGHDPAGGAGPLAEPLGHGPGPAADLQAAPPRPDSDVLEMSDGAGIEHDAEAVESFPLTGPGVVEEIVGHVRPFAGRSLARTVQ